MFEKEAEERYYKNYPVTLNIGEEERYKKVTNIWKDGAEFGYNKALKEIGDLRDCSNCKHWHYSTRSLSYYCDKTDKIDDFERQCYRCEHWER